MQSAVGLKNHNERKFVTIDRTNPQWSQRKKNKSKHYNAKSGDTSLRKKTESLIKEGRSRQVKSHITNLTSALIQIPNHHSNMDDPVQANFSEKNAPGVGQRVRPSTASIRCRRGLKGKVIKRNLRRPKSAHISQRSGGNKMIAKERANKNIHKKNKFRLKIDGFSLSEKGNSLEFKTVGKSKATNEKESKRTKGTSVARKDRNVVPIFSSSNISHSKHYIYTAKKEREKIRKNSVKEAEETFMKSRNVLSSWNFGDRVIDKRIESQHESLWDIEGLTGIDPSLSELAMRNDLQKLQIERNKQDIASCRHAIHRAWISGMVAQSRKKMQKEKEKKKPQSSIGHLQGQRFSALHETI